MRLRPNGSQTVNPAESVSYVVTAKGPGGSASAKVDIVVEPAPAPAAAAPAVTLVAKPEKIKPGQLALLEWKAQNADEVRIEPGIGEVKATGSRKVTPTKVGFLRRNGKGTRGIRIREGRHRGRAGGGAADSRARGQA